MKKNKLINPKTYSKYEKDENTGKVKKVTKSKNINPFQKPNKRGLFEQLRFNSEEICKKFKEQQKIINDTVEKKLTLSKLQSTIWEKSNNANTETFNLAEMDEDVLQALIQKDLDNQDFEEGYKLD